ncbi:MAG: hypothetical protein ABH824_00725 [Nanoarchaeota archaeon]|nr:hypothetical protein [Nanoarchaeota archaeon]MBU1631663.1 hypothetical protein [Nanoarchaeota archaeon]MBU1875633.1 hypothetical protein [Nanoarchaeota archaeon]
MYPKANKKANLGLTAVAIILALVILGFFLVSLALRECNSNKECPDDSYCGTDYECHPYPDEIIVKKNNLLSAAIVLGVSLIIAAYLFKNGKIPLIKKLKLS